MGCNACNHPLNCNCGWGGDTGGGYRRGGSIPAPVKRRIVEGRDWSEKSAAVYDSFTIPNAACPVCDASVFFYQSPHGGRVFFDHLGPPWPKHPCTDRGSASQSPRRTGTHFTSGSVLDTLVLAPSSPPKAQKGFSFVAPHVWRPLVAKKGQSIEAVDAHVRFPVDSRERVPGGRFYFPHDWSLDGPTYWRWHPTCLGKVELTTIRFGKDLLPAELAIAIPGWLRTDDELRVWVETADAAPTAEQMSAVGWAFSFAWQFGADRNLWTKTFAGVDMTLARQCFEIAATTGFWVALNNLGVIWRDGLGVVPDPGKAFFCFRQAAESGQAVPMRHLARCYREGFGCPVDYNMAIHLESMIVDMEAAAVSEATQ
jgi:hypothetical protein